MNPPCIRARLADCLTPAELIAYIVAHSVAAQANYAHIPEGPRNWLDDQLTTLIAAGQVANGTAPVCPN